MIAGEAQTAVKDSTAGVDPGVRVGRDSRSEENSGEPESPLDKYVSDVNAIYGS